MRCMHIVVAAAVLSAAASDAWGNSILLTTSMFSEGPNGNASADYQTQISGQTNSTDGSLSTWNTSGAATVGDPSNVHIISFKLQATDYAFIYGHPDAGTSYSATFQLDQAVTYELTIAGTASNTATGYDGFLANFGMASASLVYNNTGQTIGGIDQEASKNTSVGDSIHLTGILLPGSYSVVGLAAAAAGVEEDPYSASSSALVTLDLAMDVAPEPSSLVLLGSTAAFGLCYLGWRRRQSAVAWIS